MTSNQRHDLTQALGHLSAAASIIDMISVDLRQQIGDDLLAPLEWNILREAYEVINETIDSLEMMTH